MSSTSSHHENEHSHRQGSITSLLDEDDQITTDSDPSILQRNSSSNENSKVSTIDDTQSFTINKESQTATIDLQTVPDINNENNTIQNWKQVSGETSTNDQHYQNISQSDVTDNGTASFELQQQQQDQTKNNYQLNQNLLSEEINLTTDYETLVRSNYVYFDPNPEVIRKPQMITPLIYKQNIMIKFLKPPPIPQGPLIIREVRPPPLPPPPPLIIRQRPPPPLSPPPIILREKPPRVPTIMTSQVLTKTLPPLPPPPRSVIIEKLPPLPPKPRDIIIERWIPYEATTFKRKVVVQQAQEPKPHPPPKNIIITYDKIEAQVVRQFQRLGIKTEDPQQYLARFGDSLLDTKALLAQVKELGITEDVSLPNLIDQELKENLTSNSSEQNISYENSFQQKKFEKRSSNESSLGSFTTDEPAYGDTTYAPTYDNLINGSSSLINYDELNENLIGQENNGEDLSVQLAQFGLTTESIPY